MMMIEPRIGNVDENVSSIFEVPDFYRSTVQRISLISRFLLWSHRRLNNRVAQLAVLHAVCCIVRESLFGVSLGSLWRGFQKSSEL
jgi:hypothetical protein